MMDNESKYLLQKIDCNCNDCKWMQRNLSKPPQKGISHPINYGWCCSKDIDVSFIPGVCSIENQECFKHRKDD